MFIFDILYYYTVSVKVILKYLYILKNMSQEINEIINKETSTFVKIK